MLTYKPYVRHSVIHKHLVPTGRPFIIWVVLLSSGSKTKAGRPRQAVVLWYTAQSMHKHHLGGAVSAIAMTAVSIGVIAFAVGSNGGLVTSVSNRSSSSARTNVSLARSYQEVGVDQEILTTDTAASPSSMNVLAYVKKSVRRARPKPVTPPAPTTDSSHSTP